jgi:hypothetical protein
MIDPALLGRLRSVAGDSFQELAGASVVGDFPLTNAVVNRLIAGRLAASTGPVAGVQLEALDDDVFSALVSLRSKIIPDLKILGRIEEQPQLPQRPVLGIRWSMSGIGRFGMFAGPALTFLNALPRGLRAEDDRILVDLAELLQSQGLGDLLPYLHKLRVHSRRGAFVVKAELAI